MSVKRCFKWMLFLTFMALIYINMQMQIFSLGYEGKHRQKRIQELTEDNGAIIHYILALKSADHLGNELLNRNPDLRFMDRQNILTLHAPGHKPVVFPSRDRHRMNNPWTNVLSFLTTQEARAGDQR